VVALDPGRLLIDVDREVSAIDAAIRESRASKTFKRAWREFVAAWRAHFREEALQPSPGGGRQTLMFRRRAQEWRRSWQLEHAGDVGWDPEMGSFIVTPGAIKAEMETVKTGVNQLDADIMSGKVRDAFKNAWRAFVAEWNAFYKDNQGWWARGFGKTYTKTVDFRRRVDEWRAAFLKEGGATTGPMLTPSEPASGSSWKTALIAGGALLVAGALISKAASR
jgi:hypothetical protein